MTKHSFNFCPLTFRPEPKHPIPSQWEMAKCPSAAWVKKMSSNALNLLYKGQGWFFGRRFSLVMCRVLFLRPAHRVTRRVPASSVPRQPRRTRRLWVSLHWKVGRGKGWPSIGGGRWRLVCCHLWGDGSRGFYDRYQIGYADLSGGIDERGFRARPG